MSLAIMLKQLRTSNRESLQKVADAVGVSKAHIWELEKGTSKKPSMDLVTKLAKHFKIPVSKLVGEMPVEGVDDERAMVMFREFKELDPRDQKTIQEMIDVLNRGKSE